MGVPFGTSQFGRRYAQATRYKAHECSRNRSTTKSQSTTLNTLGDARKVGFVDFGIAQRGKIVTRIDKIVKHFKSYTISGNFVTKDDRNETKVHSHQPVESQSRVYTFNRDIDPEPDIAMKYGH